MNCYDYPIVGGYPSRFITSLLLVLFMDLTVSMLLFVDGVTYKKTEQLWPSAAAMRVPRSRILSRDLLTTADRITFGQNFAGIKIISL